MVGITDQERAATRVLNEQFDRTRAGRRWQRLFRAHEGELAGLVAVHPDVREHVVQALESLAQACAAAARDERAARTTGHPVARIPAQRSAVVDVARTVLQDLERLGSFELSRDAATLREELDAERGLPLAEALAAS